MENLEKLGKSKDRLRKIHPKNHENFQTPSLGSNFTGSYKKECNISYITERHC